MIRTNTTLDHRALIIAAAAFALLLGACRPDPGPNPYAEQEDFLDDDSDVFYDGPDPYDGSESRLSLSVFYEGGFSELIAVDGVSRHYYIYDDEFSGVTTFTQEPDSDRLEGYVSDRIVHSGNPWWGGGIQWDAPRSLSSWTTIHLSFKSADPSFADLQLAMESEDGGIGLVPIADYGFVDDGEWHSIAIPLADFRGQGVNLNSVSIPLRFDGAAGEAGESLLVDNLYLSR